MRTSCIEGVAIHGDLGSCAGVREGAGEALTEGDVGRVIEPRNHLSGVPTPSQWPEGNIAGGVMREPPGDPARSENLCMYGIFMRENREVPRLPVRVMTGWAAQGTPRR